MREILHNIFILYEHGLTAFKILNFAAVIPVILPRQVLFSAASVRVFVCLSAQKLRLSKKKTITYVLTYLNWFKMFWFQAVEFDLKSN